MAHNRLAGARLLCLLARHEFRRGHDLAGYRGLEQLEGARVCFLRGGKSTSINMRVKLGPQACI